MRSRRSAALLFGAGALVVAAVALAERRESDDDASGAEIAAAAGSSRLIFDPSWSPRGDTVAFAAGLIGGRFGIFVVPVRGGMARRLTPRDIDAAGAPTWDTRGRRLVFTTGTSDLGPDDSRELYVVGANGKGLRRLSRNTVDDTMPSWSPNGETIAFIRGREGDYDLYLTQPRTGVARRLTEGPPLDEFPSWSHDSRTIAFVRDSDSIYALPLGRGQARRLEHSPTVKEYTAYSPTSRILAYWQDGLWLRDPQGRARPIGWRGRTLESPLTWSPDGRRIAFQVAETDIYGPKRIWVVDVRSGRRLPLGQGWGNMSWSPDGSRLVFASLGSAELYVIRANRRAGRRRIPVRFPAD